MVAVLQVIADITRRMGAGMAKYIQQDVETIADYDEYCHFVAGLVGVGLSQVSLALSLMVLILSSQPRCNAALMFGGLLLCGVQSNASGPSISVAPCLLAVALFFGVEHAKLVDICSAQECSFPST